jgi:hypothetical protein
VTAVNRDFLAVLFFELEGSKYKTRTIVLLEWKSPVFTGKKEWLLR